MKPLSVLIVDDNEADRYLIRRALKKSGYNLTITEKNNAVDALACFKERRESMFDMVFLDINMPLMNGFQLLEELHRLRDKLSIGSCFFTMFSSSFRPDDRERALSCDFVRNYLVKGEFGPEDVKNIIGQLTAGSR